MQRWMNSPQKMNQFTAAVAQQLNSPEDPFSYQGDLNMFSPSYWAPTLIINPFFVDDHLTGSDARSPYVVVSSSAFRRSSDYGYDRVSMSGISSEGSAGSNNSFASHRSWNDRRGRKRLKLSGEAALT